MRNRSFTKRGDPSCPVCASHGVETTTEFCDDRAISVDAGLTQPLYGVPCWECAGVMSRSRKDSE